MRLSRWIPIRRLWLLAVLIAAPAPGQEAAMDFIFPRLDRTDYAELCTQIGLNDEQRQITDLLYRDYLSSIDALAKRIDAEAVKAGSDQVAAVFAGRSKMKSDELRSLRIDVLRVFQRCGGEADGLLGEFLGGLEGVLLESQKPHMADVLRDLRRKITLHPLQTGSETFSYAGEGVDVTQLVEQARATGGELEKVDDAVLDPLLEEYEIQLDAVLQSPENSIRDRRMDSRIARLGKDPGQIKQHDHDLINAWAALYTLNRDTVRKIGDVVRESSGDWAERLWLERLDRACFTWLYTRRKTDKQIDWMRSNEVSSDIMQDAELKYALYLADRDRLQKEAITILVAARLERGIILHQLTSAREAEESASDLYQALLRNSGAMTNLDTKYAGEIEAMLNEDQRREMRRYVELHRR